MMQRIFCAAMLSALIVPGAWADIAGPDGRRGPHPLPPLFGDDGQPIPVDGGLPKDSLPKPLPRLLIVMDRNEPGARLVLPAKATAALKAEEARTVRTAGIPWVGLALASSLIGGGLCLTRLPGARLLLALALPLAAIALAGMAVAQPARPESARTVIETMKVRISRASIGSDYHLVLPKR